jgi:hypothetical protein
MEKLFYDLSENEFSKGRKILAWIFSGVFFLAGLGIIYMNLVQHDSSIHISFSIPPFGISIFGGIVAYLATTKRKDHYFLMDNEKIEYRYGLIKPVKSTHNWNDIIEIIVPHRERNVMITSRNNQKHIINLTWLEKKKTHYIRKHFFYAAREKNIKLLTVKTLPKK